VKRWIARLADAKWPGGVVTGGSLHPAGTVHLEFRLTDAGVHTGREVNVEIPPEHLIAVHRLLSQAIRTSGLGGGE
jgi:hypothetical protein